MTPTKRVFRTKVVRKLYSIMSQLSDPRAVSQPEYATTATVYTERDLMTKARWRDRFQYYENLPHQQAAVVALYDDILNLQGGASLLSEDARWAKLYSEPQRGGGMMPSFPNPLPMKWQSQRDNASGMGYRECFSSSCAMIAMYWKKVANDDEYNRVRATFGDTTSVEAQLRALKALGLEAGFYQNGKTTDLKTEIDQGRPVAVGWLHQGPISAPTGTGHWSVISGYGPDYWVMNDPNGEALLVSGGYSNITDGNQRRYSFKNWNPRWQPKGEGDGWMITVKG